MYLKFYGVRGGFPTTEQMVSLFISTEYGSIIIDVGSSTIFHDNGVVFGISGILITHNHNDHVAMLPHLILARLYQARSSMEGLDKCLIVAPQSVSAIMQTMDLNDGDSFCYTEQVPQHIAGMELQAIVTNHSKRNYSYKLQYNNHSIVYTGDTSYYPGLTEFCTDVDCLICEATYSDSSIEKARHWGHMTPRMVAQLVNEAKPRTTVLTHFTEIDGEDFAKEVRKNIAPSFNIVSAFGGFEFHIP